MILHMFRIFNGCALLEYFPVCWKNAAVVMIPKPKKDPLSPVNHLSISLLNTLSKVFERLILSRLKIYSIKKIRPNNMVLGINIAPLSNSSMLLTLIINFRNLREETATIFLDVQKAFDKVWHSGLIFKFIATGITTQLINIIKSFLFNRSFYIKINDSSSSTKPIDAGLPQGSCFSLYLFAFYVNDLSRSLDSNNALFADDILFYSTCTSNSSAVNKLQKQIDMVQPRYVQRKITI